jgi:hypothetical protein
MNDHDAMDAVNAVLDEWFKGDLAADRALMQIARISGMNSFEHDEVKEQK